MQIRNSVLLLSIAVMCSCGGGGGGGGGGTTPTATIDAANAETVASVAISAAGGIVDVSESGTGVVFARVDGAGDAAGIDLKAFFGRRIRGILGAAATRQVVTTEVEPGPNGGSVTTIWNDKAPEEVVSTGDTFRMSFANYSDTDITIDGELILDQMTVTGDPEFDETWVVGSRLSFRSLSVTEGSEQGILTGAMTGRAEQTVTDSILDLRVSATLTDGTSTIAAGTTMRYAEDLFGDYTLNSKGAVRDGRIAGLVSFETTTTFTGDSSSDFPSGGVLLIKGAARSTIQLTALNSTTVELKIDKDGDGTFETIKTVPWTSLD